MRTTASAAVLGGFALLLTGCGDSMRGYLERDTPAQTTAVRQDLTMPPDLRLAPPGTAPAGVETPAPATYDNSLATTATAAPAVIVFETPIVRSAMAALNATSLPAPKTSKP